MARLRGIAIIEVRKYIDAVIDAVTGGGLEAYRLWRHPSAFGQTAKSRWDRDRVQDYLALMFVAATVLLIATARGEDWSSFSPVAYLSLAVIFGTEVILRVGVLHALLRLLGGKAPIRSTATVYAYLYPGITLLSAVGLLIFWLTQMNALFYLAFSLPALAAWVPVPLALRKAHSVSWLRTVFALAVGQGLVAAALALLAYGKPAAADRLALSPKMSEADDIVRCLGFEPFPEAGLGAGDDESGLFRTIDDFGAYFDGESDWQSVPTDAVALRRVEAARLCVSSIRPAFESSKALVAAATALTGTVEDATAANPSDFREELYWSRELGEAIDNAPLVDAPSEQGCGPPSGCSAALLSPMERHRVMVEGIVEVLERYNDAYEMF